VTDQVPTYTYLASVPPLATGGTILKWTVTAAYLEVRGDTYVLTDGDGVTVAAFPLGTVITRADVTVEMQ
jgi:hypothetical protein